MLSKSQIHLLRSLQQKKFRLQHGCFVAEGAKLLLELLRSNFEAEGVYAIPSWLAGFSHRDSDRSDTTEISEKELGRISSLVNPNQVLAVVKTPLNKPLQASELSGLILIPDGISDPGNMGSFIRLADWHGIRNEIREFVDVMPNISSFEASAESLNAAVVRGIVCSEFRKTYLMKQTMSE